MEKFSCFFQHVYPLLYLVLKHHARIIKTACHHIINVGELDYWGESLDSIVTIVKQRVETLRGLSSRSSLFTQSHEYIVAIYKQVYVDAGVKLENFAFGMVRHFYTFYSAMLSVLSTALFGRVLTRGSLRKTALLGGRIYQSTKTKP